MGWNYVSELRPPTDKFFIPQMMSMENHGEMLFTGEIDQLREKPAPVPLCPPQNPNGLPRARLRVSAMRGRRLTAWAMARPFSGLQIQYGTGKQRQNAQCTGLPNLFRPRIGDPIYTRFCKPRFRISVVLFQCHKEHKYPIRGQNLKPIYYLRRIFSRLIRECDADEEFSIKEFWHQFKAYASFYAFPIHAAIRRNAPPPPPCITKVTYSDSALTYVAYIMLQSNAYFNFLCFF
jgi:hypothetical protein